MRRIAVFLGLLLALGSPAWAHVDVSPETAAKGGPGTFTFNVEDERDTANETIVEFYLPAGLTSANVHPSGPAGWDFVFTSSPGSVRFTHRAPGPQGDQGFTLAIDQLPVIDELVFKTVVTYDNGDVDRWIDSPTAGDEPPHPAPVVKLTGTATTPPDGGTAPSRVATTMKRSDKGSNAAGIAAVIIAAVLVVGGLVVFATRGRTR